MPSNRPIANQGPELGVVILSAGKDLGMVERCLRSVLAACKRLPSAWEVIFLDNASESGIGIPIAELFPQITVLRFPERVGFSTGNNAGFRLTTAKLIIQLNDDTEIAEDAVVKLADFFRNHAEVGAVGPRLETPAGELQVGYYARRLPTLLDIAFHLFGLNALWRGNPVARRYFLIGEEDRTRAVEQPAGAALTYRRAALFQVGLLDEDYTFAYDDVDICRRLADGGWTIFYLQQARVTHLGAVSLQPTGPRLSRHTLNGILCYWRKHGTAFEYATVRLMMFTSLILRLPVELVLNRTNPDLRREIASVYLDGIFALLRTLVRPYQPQRLSVCAPIEVNTEMAWEARRG